ncbi:MAG TPA: hypothetical protein PLF13_03270 [candidate division Zixibacteria bacterium]|nr:hypothetical protein [candidate division Zixibacteria bacterium]
MHPTRRDIERAILKLLPEEECTSVLEHVEKCEFCREIADDFRNFQQATPVLLEEDLAVARKTFDRLHRQSTRGLVISFTRLPSDDYHGELSLAADGDRADTPQVEELATLVSEKHDLVLRLMHDHSQSQDLLELVSSDPAVIHDALIEAPSLNHEFVADKNGRVLLPKSEKAAWEAIDWRIRLPEARFELKPLEFNADAPDSIQSVELHSEQDDRIRVRLETRDSDCSLVVEILELRGRTELEGVRAIVAAGTASGSGVGHLGVPFTFDLPDRKTPITIRIYSGS